MEKGIARLGAPLGLTLVELLITLLVFSVLTVMGYQALALMVEHQHRLTLEGKNLRDNVLVWARLERDLSALASVPVSQLSDWISWSGGESSYQLDLVNASWLWNGESLIRIDKQHYSPRDGVTLLNNVTGFSVALISPTFPDQPLQPGVSVRWQASANSLGLLFRVEGAVAQEKAILIGRGAW